MVRETVQLLCFELQALFCEFVVVKLLLEHLQSLGYLESQKHPIHGYHAHELETQG
jgi:hypothetical protein